MVSKSFRRSSERVPTEIPENGVEIEKPVFHEGCNIQSGTNLAGYSCVRLHPIVLDATVRSAIMKKIILHTILIAMVSLAIGTAVTECLCDNTPPVSSSSSSQAGRARVMKTTEMWPSLSPNGEATGDSRT